MKHIKVKVHPLSKKELFIEKGTDLFEVYLREPKEKGLANKRLLDLLCEELRPKPKILKIVSGHLSQSKTIKVEYE